AFLGDHRGRVLGRFDIAIDEQHLGALAREQDRGRASIANRLAGGLPRADDDTDFIFHPHMGAPAEASRIGYQRPMRASRSVCQILRASNNSDIEKWKATVP